MLEGARTIAGEKGTVTERSFVMVRLLRLSHPGFDADKYMFGKLDQAGWCLQATRWQGKSHFTCFSRCSRSF